MTSLTEIANDAADEIKSLILEAEEAIIDDIKKTAEEAQLQGKEKYSFKLTHTIVLDLSEGSQKHSLTWNVSRRTNGESIPLKLHGNPEKKQESGPDDGSNR